MKKLIIFFFALVLFTSVTAVQAQRPKWNEMEEFHKVMGATFHPAEEGKLEPIKSRSGEMVEKAKAWKKSDAPEGYDKKAIRKQLKELVKGSKELDKMVNAQATDASITQKLTQLHDVFHEIMDHARKK